MTVDTAAGSSDVHGGIGPAVSRTMAAAESVLSHRFGATVRLAEPEDLGGSSTSTVIRVRVASTPFSLPRTLVVKRYGEHDPTTATDAFRQEAVSYQLFTALAPDERMCPEMFAHDGEQRLVVLEDLGRSPTLADKLVSDDARAAERALLSWARSLGRLHASTAGREQDFDALSRRLGMPKIKDPLAASGRAALAELPELLHAELGVATTAAEHDRATAVSHLLEPGGRRAFSPSDASPDNNLITSRGVRFLDFEGGCWRNVLLDAGGLRLPFPSAGDSFALPAGMTEAMVAAWRAEAREMWPDLDVDANLLPGLLDAQAFWVWVSTWWLLPRDEEPDEPVGDSPGSPPRSVVLRARWAALAADAEHAGDTVLGGHARSVLAGLERRYGAREELAPYPAFR
jgi:hypothetical protein